MTNILFAAGPDRWDDWAPPLRAALDQAGLGYALAQDMAPEVVDYIVYAPDSALQDFTPFTRCKAVLNTWAGVEAVVGNQTLTQPLARMVGGGLTEGMVEYVLGHSLRHHLGMDAHIVNPDHDWHWAPPPLASERRVTVLGLGALGAEVAQKLAGVGFAVTGWSRRPKEIGGVRTLNGDDGLAEALRGAEILVLLLPDTPATENILDAEALALLARGAFVINPGRGPLIDDQALLAALDSGQIGHATLDVFREEPLPKNHPFWAHPGVTVTPHVASETRAASGAGVIAENILRGEAGQPFLHLVDRTAGY
ncbi:MAG: glyoxylate/hydroxypyruvate reductase A [Marinovum algicola]|jgi:glyoxylate/hydroxypyruvate reductase A|uniref:Glyoxylate/hydroxypyruvate reductase A n=1 Tax=Marinovum algicola TaxID=42444 RepID=A0A975WC67_9RHOB|nr:MULTISPECIES: glyoxylate/hydroxypyruvate reductase A [Marinovum]MDD9742040.1 glyoxylate/hydroxypyruvate reductase A [Marinovum sp. SP66]SEJ87197.1 glyoxylate/hydroxypyruvate reductase A [Marinovum algicola]SLN67022.1 Glyoxylate/hydroxypyruvate reductase A [Marinovum algicola]